jgi:hypothetical protein
MDIIKEVLIHLLVNGLNILLVCLVLVAISKMSENIRAILVLILLALFLYSVGSSFMHPARGNDYPYDEPDPIHD